MSASTMSVLAAALEASRKSRYAPACANRTAVAGGAANNNAAEPAGIIDLADHVRYPNVSDMEVGQMSASIAPALHSITCYDIMGSSTQVVVVEEESSLTIPFIAAQETQVSTCFVWSSERRRYTGVLSITEYIKVLLHCESNPSAVDAVTNMTVRQWLDLKRSSGDNNNTSAAPEALVSATADESLAVCIGRMLTNRVRRLAVVADDEDDPRHETSILGVFTFDTLIQNVASRLFSTDIFGNSTNRSADDDGLPASVQSIVNGSGDGAGDDINEALDSAVASATGAYRTIFDVPYARLRRLGTAAQQKSQTGHYPDPIYVTINTPVAEALKLLLQKGLHSVAVVDNASGVPIIIDTISRNDVIRMETGGVFNLSVTVGEALRITNGTVRPLIAVFYESDSLRSIIEHLAVKRVPVLFLVDPKTDAMIGQLGIAEVFTFLFESSLI